MSTKQDLNNKPVKRLYVENIPQALKAIPQWIVWNWQWNGKKWNKPPLRLDGSGARVNEVKSAYSFEDVSKVADSFDGVGFILEGSSIIGVDIDNCRNSVTGELTQFATDVINQLDTYCEVSPSGEGVKLLIRTTENGIERLNGYRCKNDRVGLEVYCRGRYFTITGDTHSEKDIRLADETFWKFMDEHLKRSVTEKMYIPADIEASEQLSIAQKALEFIDPDCDYQTWLDIGMALKSVAESAFSIWDEWSSGGGKYTSNEELLRKWNSFREKA